MSKQEKEQVVVIVPIYKEEQSHMELAALANNLSVLATYPVVFLKPKGLRLDRLRSLYPHVRHVEVSDEWLGSKNGIQGYNRMMLSEQFYAMFLQYEYMLICHVDAWVFEDRLSDWCSMGFDHVAAPWPTPTIYRVLPLRALSKAWHWLTGQRHTRHSQLFGQIGNGGFSLRRVETFYNVCLEQGNFIAQYEDNEDIFWALLAPGLSVPSERQALAFAFDQKPWLCLRRTQGTLPMACHGFSHPRLWRRTWQHIIPINENK